ncbi:MAG: PIN domain-containing protein [Verrucomicrobia bacterium]|nr:PIN domain-containing protein [Verrucomicrobiota bacterium]
MKPGFYLVDTGALVALLDRNDPAHAQVREAWLPLSGRFHTTGAVVTEAMHFLRSVAGGAGALAGLLAKGPIHIEDIFAPLRLEAVVALMARYADAPMDFADATLVLLAERLGTPHILTLDERGFRTFRFAGRRHFHLVLQDG